MYEITLSGDDERVRVEAEHEAEQFWPGARVLVHADAGQYWAAVFLSEDGVDPDASAERSGLHHTPRAAVDEVLSALRHNPASLRHA